MTAHTPTPWAWMGNGKDIQLASLSSMRPFVMTFDRVGMQGAGPNFNVDGIMVPAHTLAIRPQSHNPWLITGIDHPDAEFILRACNAHDHLVTMMELLADPKNWQGDPQAIPIKPWDIAASAIRGVAVSSDPIELQQDEIRHLADERRRLKGE